MNFIPKIEYNELGTGTLKTINFGNPPEGDPFGERDRPNVRKRRSTGGVQQTQFNYMLTQFRLEFNFQSETVKNAYQDFYRNHASQGGAFKYYPHNDEVDFETYEMTSSTQSYKRPIPSGVVGEFEYDLDFTIERVL